MQYFTSLSLRPHSRVFALEDDPGQEIFPPHAWRRLVSTTILTEDCDPLDASEYEYETTGLGALATCHATVTTSATTASKSPDTATNTVAFASMSAVTASQNAATAQPGVLATAFERSLAQPDKAIPNSTPILHASDEGKSQRRSSRAWLHRHLSSTPAISAAASATGSALNPAMSSVVNSSNPPTASASDAHAAPMASASANGASATAATPAGVQTSTLASTSTRISAPQQALKQALEQIPRKRSHSETIEEAKSSLDATDRSKTVLLYVPEKGEDDFADVAFLKKSRHTSKLNPHGFKPAKQQELWSLPPMKRQAVMRKIFIWRRNTRNWRERHKSTQNTDSDSDHDIGSSRANVVEESTECDAAEPPSVLECSDNPGFDNAIFSSSPSYSPSIDFDGDYEDGEANGLSKRHKSGVAVAPQLLSSFQAKNSASAAAAAVARVAPHFAATTLNAPQTKLYSAVAQPPRPSSATVALPPAATVPPAASLLPQQSSALLYQPREDEDDYADVVYSLVSGRYTSETNPHGFPPTTQEYLLRLTPEQRHRAMQLQFATRRRRRAWRKRTAHWRDFNNDEDED